MSDGRNTWRHYTVRGIGECTGLDDSGEKHVRYDMGIVETGRSRIFTGYFFKVTLGDDEEIIGEDGGSMVQALKRLARDAAARGLHLDCVGLNGQWRQSGLSENTGWGYFGPHQRLMHIMDETPHDAEGDVLDRVIREAVDGMRIGLV